MLTEIIIRPIGVVKSPIKDPMPLPYGKVTEAYKEALKRYFREVEEAVSEVLVFQEYEGILEGVEEFSHIIVIYYGHLGPRQALQGFKVHPMGRIDIPKKGIFATLSPRRPNPILVSPVKLLEVRADRLTVKGLDALDGSPVLDIKPYVPNYHSLPEAVSPKWIKDLRREVEEGT